MTWSNEAYPDFIFDFVGIKKFNDILMIAHSQKPFEVNQFFRNETYFGEISLYFFIRGVLHFLNGDRLFRLICCRKHLTKTSAGYIINMLISYPLLLYWRFLNNLVASSFFKASSWKLTTQWTIPANFKCSGDPTEFSSLTPPSFSESIASSFPGSYCLIFSLVWKVFLVTNRRTLRKTWKLCPLMLETSTSLFLTSFFMSSGKS